MAKKTELTGALKAETGEKYPTTVVGDNAEGTAPYDADASADNVTSVAVPEEGSAPVQTDGAGALQTESDAIDGTANISLTRPVYYVPNLKDHLANGESVDPAFLEWARKQPEKRYCERFFMALDDEDAAAATATANGSSPDPSAAASPRDAYRDALTHVDERGDVRMVDVSGKTITRRIAIAEGSILMHPETQTMVLEDRAKKGDVLACARVAGIMASKRTSELIPMCHPLMITKSKVDIEPIPATGEGARTDGRVGFHVTAICGVTGVTGIEMEALTAASTACLTIYDMCKAVDRGMEIVDVRLLRKEGGRSGVWERKGNNNDTHTAQTPENQATTMDDAPSSAESSDEATAIERSPLPGGPGCGPAAPAVAFIGYQNSGKTTLVEKVISRLSQRGLRVGSIKHHGHKGFDMDQPGKDSWRHAQAGSRHVGLVSPDQWAEYASTDGEVPVRDLLSHYTDVDVVIVEGYKTAGLPSIVVARSGVDRLRGRTSFDLIDANTLAVACNDVVERDFRRRHADAERKAFENGTASPQALPPFIDINDANAIVNFILNYLGR